VDISKIILYLIAGTIAFMSAIVIIFKGVDAMPYDWVGVAGAVFFIWASWAMSRYASAAHPHG